MTQPLADFARSPSAGRTAGIASLPRIAVAAALLSIAGMAGGCAAYNQDHTYVGSVPDDYRTRHPIIVSQDEKAEDLIIPANASRLSPRDREVVRDFGQRFKQSGVQTVAILIPSGSRNEAAARRIASQVADLFQDMDIGASRIAIQHYAAAGHGDAATVRLVYSDIAARVASRCGQWPADLLDDTDNRNYANFGCATQQNLAAMVANPADLLGPRGESEIDASRRTNVIETWREDGAGELGPLFDQ